MGISQVLWQQEPSQVPGSPWVLSSGTSFPRTGVTGTCQVLQHSPEAVPVVEPALGQVPLHQVHTLSTGRTHAAGRLVGSLLCQAT
jgi:hypothetical protein